mmetsp:Transcript_5744/g.8620  ORF Transcript_5744/g.8620 Transcript_5744/m.8620 type:complete len:292 (-) Transcript_5744:298-1173(-)|eukprot:CAMPEP_0203638970 /NCGR_PEP_ID=MMETSP0088-20131115/4838_1 /ASSEMBLY_ACC=CAM_ASM_001087 /TAXON_ID=426623 /ORGANISM="Chaetoceros affinis, Strain CCMP159" /LENGTH=291 /DNA_ID=CAMNT_0050493721 /DNA_START=66 /DNA_END=941 /DNA_ORIENTATION=+
MKLHSILATISTLSSLAPPAVVTSFSPISVQVQVQVQVQALRLNQQQQVQHPQRLNAATQEAATETTTTTSFIATELRGAAMKLHTKSQSPKEGKATETPKPSEPYVPTHLDYLKFLVDSQYVYKCFEDAITNNDALHPELEPLVQTGLERYSRLEEDIQFLSSEYNIDRPDVGEKGLAYGDLITSIAAKGKENIPEFMCHYYNYYFAHTAGGRMIGKQMAALLLEKKTLEFYKWDGDLNEIKDKVKSSIEEMAASWSRKQKDQCVGATAAAFMGGGGINAYLSGGRGGHH